MRAAWFITIAFVAAVPKIPLILEANDSAGPPIWVSARRAVRADGSLDDSVFRSEDVARLRRTLDANKREWRKALSANPAAAVDDCHVFSGVAVSHFLPNRTFDELVANASVIVTGEVVDRTEGFLQGRPGSLLLVRANQYKRRVAHGDFVLVFSPSAHIRTEGGALCARPLSKTEPAVGDRLIGFGMVDHISAGGNAILEFDEVHELVVERPGGRLEGPSAIAESARSFEQIESSIVKRVGIRD